MGRASAPGGRRARRSQATTGVWSPVSVTEICVDLLFDSLPFVFRDGSSRRFYSGGGFGGGVLFSVFSCLCFTGFIFGALTPVHNGRKLPSEYC